MKLDRVEIAKRAYSIWEAEGRPDGRDIDHWLRAEAEIDGRDAKPGDEPPVSPVEPRRPTTGRARRAK